MRGEAFVKFLVALDDELTTAIVGDERERPGPSGTIGKIGFRPFVAILGIGLGELAINDEDEWGRRKERRIDPVERDLDRKSVV